MKTLTNELINVVEALARMAAGTVYGLHVIIG
jgi:hypothetical protein